MSTAPGNRNLFSHEEIIRFVLDMTNRIFFLQILPNFLDEDCMYRLFECLFVLVFLFIFFLASFGSRYYFLQHLASEIKKSPLPIKVRGLLLIIISYVLRHQIICSGSHNRKRSMLNFIILYFIMNSDLTFYNNECSCL